MMDASSLLHTTPLLVIMLALDGRIVSLNPAAATLATRSLESIPGTYITELLDPGSHTKARLLLERVQMHEVIRDWELGHIAVEGEPALISYTASLLRTDGVAVGIGLIGYEQTKTLALTARLAATNQELEGALLRLEQTHEALKVTQAQLVQAEKMRVLGQLVAGVAHEINNPASFVAANLAHLSRLLAPLDMLLTAYASLRVHATPAEAEAIARAEAEVEIEYLLDDLRDVVRESEAGMERIRSLVLALRTFGRLDEADWKEANLNDGLRSTLQMIRYQCGTRIRIIEEYGELPPILCHPGELNQVFLNLLSNAIHAIKGDGQIIVRTSAGTGGIRVEIHDTGVGMDAATQARLGEPFFTTKPIGDGTGLGLAISFGIVERHGGRLQFTSQPGQGTIAALDLPYSRSQSIARRADQGGIIYG